MSVQEASRLASTTSRRFKDAYDIDYQPHRVVTEIVLRGELDGRAMASVEQVLDQARGSGARMIVVDLRELTGIDPTALPTFARADAFCFDSAVRLRLLSCGHDHPEPVDRALESC